jgi:hypothetical protein
MARDDACELTAAEKRDLIKLINEGKALNESGTAHYLEKPQPRRLLAHRPDRS